MGKVTRKGQVTIPRELRERHNINEGDRVKIEHEGGKIVIRKISRDLEEILGSWSDLDVDEDFIRKIRREWEERLQRELR